MELPLGPLPVDVFMASWKRNTCEHVKSVRSSPSHYHQYVNGTFCTTKQNEDIDGAAINFNETNPTTQ